MRRDLFSICLSCNHLSALHDADGNCGACGRCTGMRHDEAQYPIGMVVTS